MILRTLTVVSKLDLAVAIEQQVAGLQLGQGAKANVTHKQQDESGHRLVQVRAQEHGYKH
eukprot:1159911-Pelagomonas_calceolata.AAC.5